MSINNKKNKFLKLIKNEMIVSCQAVGNEPLNDVSAITLMAKSVLEGGATVLRLSQYEHIKSISKITNVPIIGLIKKNFANSEVFITPTIAEIDQLAELKVDCIAIDATLRKRPSESLEEIILYTREKYPDVCLMADCSNLEDVLNAEKLGFDLIGTTLRGCTSETQGKSNLENDFSFIKKILINIKTPLIAEGGFWNPEQVFRVMELGVHSVVVGSAITRPKEITKMFYKKINELRERK